ncbi:hypothetical protein [Sorangium sp. So ce124]|uniref:hypothetical protein n=1 Tax=Sorangium sp. So ce124 TaxID=3133280 RepID=UPI003F63547A
MRSQGSVQLEAWAAERGGIRAAARALGVAPATLSRWIGGKQVPRGDGDLGPAWIEARTGVVAVGWDLLAAQPSPPVKARKGRAAPLPPTPPKREARARAAPVAPPSPPSGAPTATASPPEPPEPPEAPASLEDLKRRARAIPGEIRRLRGRVERGEVAVSAAETLRRLLTDERAAAIAAVESDGLATVAEVEQLQATLQDVVRGCEGCRARLVAALRGSAA